MATHEYSTADVERLTGLSRSVVRSMVRQRFIAPRRGKRRELRFSFQDLIVLRSAKALVNHRLPSRRILRSLRELRRHLPDTAPISGLSIRAVGDAVTVREGRGEWESGSGQYLLALDVVVENGHLHVIEPVAAAAAAPSADSDALFELALALEAADSVGALAAYRRCLASDAQHLEARINAARLLHEQHDYSGAEALYQHASVQHSADALFNLAVLLEDTGRIDAAIERYLAAVTLEPALADAHYNLARLYEARGLDAQMIRHLRQYQRLQPDSG